MRPPGDTGAPPMHFSALLLNGNPGIGVCALKALWNSGGCGTNNAGGLFSFLIHLDLSRCGLTIADLAGLSPTTPLSRSPVAGGRSNVNERGENRHDRYIIVGHSDADLAFSDQPLTVAVCLRALVLRDNPLTRVGIKGESKSCLEEAQTGATALRDFIARAPELEALDISGLSLPRSTLLLDTSRNPYFLVRGWSMREEK